jgi:hypothetical protein
LAGNLQIKIVDNPSIPTLMEQLEQLPYHLRAPRFRWAALAIDLDPGETQSLQQLVLDSRCPMKVRNKARLLLGLHRREPIHDLCVELHMDRRTLYRTATNLIDRRQRQALYAA